MKSLLHVLTHWKLPPPPWQWGKLDDSKNQLDMGEFIVKDPSKNNELVKIRGGVLFNGQIEFVNIHPEAPSQFLQVVANLPAFRQAFMEMRGHIVAAAQLLKEASNTDLPAEWHQSAKNVADVAKLLEKTPDEPTQPSLIVMQ